MKNDSQQRRRRGAPCAAAPRTHWLARAAVRFAGALCAWLAMVAASAYVTPAERNVLVLFTNGRLLPANVEADRGLRLGLGESTSQPMAVYDEFLDWPRFDGPEYAAIFADYLRRKYARTPPDVIVAGTWGALDFVLRHRAKLFPDAALVHMAVPGEFLRAIEAPPADMLGAPLDFDFAGTAALALKLHPQARRLVFVSGTSPQDRVLEGEMRGAAASFGGRATSEFLSGMTEAQVMARLAALGPDSVVVTLGYFRDGQGRDFVPRESVRAMAAVSGAPLYAPATTYLGTGAVGGIMPDYVAMGRQAGEFVHRQLHGDALPAPGPQASVPATMQLDWRQLQRWGVAERAIPPDAVLHFREPTLWEDHRAEVSAAAAALLLQAGLIAWLVVERQRRHRAEEEGLKRRFELAHTSRLAVAGELTGAIAHEINQPLGAILSNADTAELLLESGTDRRDELRRIVADIRADDLRASQVIRRLRALLARHEVERLQFDLVEAVQDIMPTLQAEARRRGVALELSAAAGAAPTVGDRVQMQQVLINLVLNAMDAVAGLPEPRRTVEVNVRQAGERLLLTVRDQGPGIAAEDLPKVFDSFFSTKRQGMGLGLAIARTLVEAHGGRIRADNRAGGGAVFEFELPASTASAVASATT